MNERIKRFLKSSNKEKINKIKRYLIRKKSLFFKNVTYIPSGYKKNSQIVYSGPKVSILLPVYNHANIVRESINSILEQTYKNIELIILDDGSTDNLMEVLKPYANIKNVRIYTQKNQKLPRALTHLHKFVTGDFITWTSADNIMSKNMIEILVKKLLEEPDASLVYGDVYVINAKGKPYYGMYRDIDRDTKKANIIRLLRNEEPLKLGNDNYVNASFMYRKVDSNILKGHYADDVVGAEDYDYWLRLSKSGHIKHIKEDKPLYFYRIHDNSMSHEIETKKLKDQQLRISLLQEYEKKRAEWCEIRPNLILKDLDLNEEELLKKIALKLPVDVNLQKGTKKINFSSKNLNEDGYIKIDENYYYLMNKKEEICKLFKGIDFPKQVFKARNLYSRSFYVDKLYNLKRPILGCHINSENIEIKELKNLLANNYSNYFVIIDEINNANLKKLQKNYNNFIYFPDEKFGESFEIYSNLSRIFTLSCFNNLNREKNILLAYAIGRKISYNNNDAKYYSLYPYTIPYYNNLITITHNDSISDYDYEIMDKYLKEMNLVNSLNKIIKYYNSYTQEMYVERPKYKIDVIKEEDEPKKVEFKKEV